MSSDPFDDQVIYYRTKETQISIRLDRGDIYIALGPNDNNEMSSLPLEIIARYFSKNKYAPHTSKDTIEKMNKENRIEYLLKKYSVWLKKYCQKFLRGNFSVWPEVCKFHFN